MTRVEVLRVLTKSELPASDWLGLQRVADPSDEGVRKLSPGKTLAVVEQRASVGELEQILAARTGGELPAPVVTFLTDMLT